MAKSPSINLFKGQEKSFIEKLIAWVLSFGRIIVIVTEAVALTAFLYRFSLDRQLIDLHERIKQKETIVKLLQKDEDTYRNLQDRIKLAATLGKKSNVLIKIFQEVMSFTPPDLAFNNVSLTPKNLSVDANFSSIQSLAAFVNSLRKHASVGSVSIDKIENKTSRAIISVGITATFKNNYDK